MASPRVLITPSLLQPGDDIDRLLQDSGMETVFAAWHPGQTEDELIVPLRGADGAIIDIHPFTERAFDSADQLKVVARLGVGYDAVDVRAATDHGVPVCITPGTNSVAVAEFAFALMLTCSRKIIENYEEGRTARWRQYQGTDLSGATLGIIGLGSVGKELARRARAFDMTVLAHDTVLAPDFTERHRVAYVPLEELLRESAFVSLHVFLNKESHHLINAQRLALMKPTAYLINTSRGGVVDPGALYDTLKEKRIAGAALDVFEQEPLDPDSPLRTLDNVYLFPHVAGQSANSVRAMGMMAAESVIKVIRGERPACAVNPEVFGSAR